MKKHLLLIFVLTMLFGIGARGQNSCTAPSGLTASLHNPQWYNVLLNWDAVSDTMQEDIMWSTTTYASRIGMNEAADFIGAVRFTPTDLASFEGRYLTSVTFVPGEPQTVCTYYIVVWQGGSYVDDTFNTGTMVVNQEITAPLTTTVLNTVLLDTALLIDVTQELWIGIRCNTTTGYPLGASSNGAVANLGELTYLNGEWITLSQASLPDYNWLIIGHLQNPDNIITGYNLYRDNTLLGSVNTTSYIDTLEEGTYQYDLTANYLNSCESNPVSATVTMTPYPCENCLDTAIVGNGTTGTYQLPLNTYYRYSFSEQIYTAEELGEINGRINCLSFQYIHSSSQEKDIVIYMGNTSKNSFANSSDWIPASQLVPVYQGTINFTNIGENNWVNVPFDVPFEYDGSSNIVVAVQNNTGSYIDNSNTFYVHTADAYKTLYAYQDGTVPYSVNDLPSGYTTSSRNNIRFLIGEPALCPMPTHLTITNITAHESTISWHSNEAHDGYELVLVPDSSSMENESTLTVNDTFYVFENLAANTTYHVYLRTICSSENSSWIYPVTFTTEPTCTTPIDLTVSQIAGTSALVAWEPAEIGATAYNVSYTEAGQENWTTETVNGFQYMLSGLNPQTAYEVSVTSVCEEGSAPAATKTFTTHCLAGGEIPIGNGTTTSNYLPSYSYYNYGYSQQIFLASEFNGPTEISSISINMENLSQQRNYKIYLKHTSTAELSSGWASTTGAQLVYSGPQTLIQGWNTFDFATPFSYNGTDNLLVIFIDSTGSYVSGNAWYTHNTASSLARYMYQDSSVYPLEPTSSSSGYSLNARNNVKFGGECDETVTCVAPNAYLSDITSESMTLNWVSGYMENSWEVEYCTDTANWISVGTLTSSPYTFDNLVSNTAYTVRMRSVCGSDEYSDWKTIHARTACDDIAVLPFIENFDNYGIGTDIYPSCWDRINTTSGSYPYITSTYYSGTGSLYFYAGTSGTCNIAITPPISADIPVNTLQANFMYRAYYTSDMLIVGVMTDPAYESTFVPVDTIYPAANPGAWTEQRVTFDQYTGEGQYIAFKNQYASTYCYGYIDDLVIDLKEDCLRPMHVVATSTTTDTVYLSWDANGGTSWDVIYGPVGFDPEDETESSVLIQGVTDNPFTISGLADGIGYDFYVRTNCGDNVSSWNDHPASGFPFSYVMGTTGSDTLTGCGFTITDNGGPNGNYTDDCDFTVVIYPSGSDSLVSVSGIFEGEGTWDKLYIYDGAGTSNQIAMVASTPQVNFGPFVSFSGPLTIRFTSDGSNVNAGFAAITSCVAVPDCPSPIKNSVTATNIDGHNATISFTDNNPEHDSWTVFYRPTTTNDEDPWMSVVTNDVSVVLTNLSPETSYSVYVITNCDTPDEVADATYTIQFTTLVACPNPQNVTVSNIGMTSATITWFSNADSFTIEYGEAGFTPGNGTTVTTTENSYDLTDLTSSTSYTVYVTADCGIDGTSSLASVNFGTANCEVADQCVYTFILSDSYGDGWNGGTLAVKQNGTTVTTISMDSGISSTETVSLCDNVSTSLEWTAGYYPGECSFTVMSPNGSELYISPTMDSYTTYTFTTDCGGTPQPTDPTVATTAATAIAQTSATLNATITNPDNVTVTAKGFEWKTTTGGTYTQIAGTGTGNTFTANLTGLTANTGYTFKAFITFNGTTVYGNEMTFNTLPEDVEPCDAPTGLTAGDITGESIAVSWNATANAESYNIQYSPQGGTVSSASSSTNSYTITGLEQNTTYQIQVQANCGNGNLSGWSQSITVQTTGINNHLYNSIALYPNPAKEYVDIRIDGDANVTAMEVYDVYGKLINTVNVVDNPTRINVSGLANGMYFVRVTTEQGVVTKTFVKK